jgi:nitroreductase
MLSTEPRPALPQERSEPTLRATLCWPALMIGLAIVLDALRPLAPGAGTLSLLWLDLAALVTLAWAALGPRRAKDAGWATPLEGIILSGLLLGVLHVVRLHGAAGPVLWLRQIAAAGLCYYALTALLRRDPNPTGAVWPAFAAMLLALSAWAIGWATVGVTALRAASLQLDLNWLSRYGLPKALMVLTLLAAGRACEPGARALWRVTALIGAVACTLCLVVGGAGLGVGSLASLDEPFYFATSIVVFLLLASLSRMAWQLTRDRPEEAGRWWGMTLMFPLIAALLLFGGTTGGEGVRALTALAGAAVVAARDAPRAAVRRPVAPSAAEPPVARAA